MTTTTHTRRDTAARSRLTADTPAGHLPAPSADDDLDRGLHTLSYPVDPDALGDLVLYQLTREFLAAWDGLVAQIRRRADRDEVTPSYASLATALTAATNRPVRLFPQWQLSPDHAAGGTVALLVTTAPIDGQTVTAAVGRFEQLSTANPDADTLAPLLRGVTSVTRPLRDYLHRDAATGSVAAPGWLFDAARWNLAARIAAAPLLLDDSAAITLRLDTEGNLLAFDHPLSRTSSNGITGHATVYVSTRIVTVPGAAQLYLRLDGHVARHPYTWRFTKNTWLDRGDPDLPILRLPVLSPYPAKGRSEPTFRGYTAEVVESCGLHPITLPTQTGAELGSGTVSGIGGVPGPVRPIGKPRTHSIGTGPGVRFLYQLGQHATRQLGVPPLRYARTRIAVGSSRITGPIPVDRLDDAVTTADIGRLRIVCFYATPETRRRMTDALAAYADTPATLTGIPDDQPVTLTRRISAVLHHAPTLLTHGTHARTLDGIPWLDPTTTSDNIGGEASEEAGEDAIAVLAETYWDPANPPAPAEDSKHPVRRLLAQQGVVSQFVNSRRAPTRARRRVVDGRLQIVEPSDQPATAAVRDLLRQCGVLDNRLAAATANPRLAGHLDREATLVAVHIRQHTPRRRGRHTPPTRLVIRLVALHATPDPHLPWRTLTYSDTQATWVPYRVGTADYHATEIGSTNLSRKVADRPKIRDYVDQALTAGRFDRTRPVVIFLDAEACKGIWPGLNDTTFGTAALPGDDLDHPDIAVVRCANGDRVAQPTHRGHGPQVPDPHQPNLPGATLYHHDENDTASWLLAQASRTYRSSQPDSRAGALHTRWTVPEDKTRLVGDDWHGLTAIEIAAASTGSWPPHQLAALTARLCQQAGSWDDRTHRPAPLHLAERTDLDHPQRGESPSGTDDAPD